MLQIKTPAGSTSVCGGELGLFIQEYTAGSAAPIAEILESIHLKSTQHWGWGFNAHLASMQS